MINSRKEACDILGVNVNSTMADIKSAYKNLAKKYHPDSGNTENVSTYYLVTEAYGYLCDVARNQTAAGRTGNVVGSPVSSDRNWYSTRKHEHDNFEKQYKKLKEQRAREFKKHVDEYNKKEEKRKKQQEEYDRAMKAIDAILVAEAIKAMIND